MMQHSKDKLKGERNHNSSIVKSRKAEDLNLDMKPLNIKNTNISPLK